jgi:chromosome segregation ATPase
MQVRVLKRNQSLSLPEELKKLGERLRLMDLERRRAIADKEEKDAEIAAIKKELTSREEEIVSLKIDKAAWARRASDSENELNAMKHSSEGERKLMQMEKMRLSDKNNYFRVKLQENLLHPTSLNQISVHIFCRGRKSTACVRTSTAAPRRTISFQCASAIWSYSRNCT